MTDLIPAWVDGALQPADKLEVHLKGLRHKAVSVFVNAGGKTLIQRRALSKYHTPGLWANACCTHPHWEEDPQDCAIRRLREELNIDGLDVVLKGHVHYRADVGGGMVEDEEVDIFVAEAAHPFGVSPNPAEAMDARWVGFEDLARDAQDQPDRFTPWLRIYLSEHRALIG